MFGPAFLVRPGHHVSCAEPDGSICRRTRRGMRPLDRPVRARRPVDQRAPRQSTHDARARSRRLDRARRSRSWNTPDEKPADPVTLYVYAGADGVFTLYDDDGISSECEKRRLDAHPHDVGRRVEDADHLARVRARIQACSPRGRSVSCSSRRSRRRRSWVMPPPRAR